MTSHLLRLMWNRKGRNALLCAEIFFSFVAIAAIGVIAVNYANNWRQGLGYRIDDVWNIQVVPPGQSDTGQFPDGTARTFGDIVNAVRALPGVQAVAGVTTAPYSNSEGRGGIGLTDGREAHVFFNGASDDLPAVLGLELVAGRWFGPEDASSTVAPIVINQRLATEVFGDADAAGQMFPEVPPPPERQNPWRPWRPRRVVGVISEFRKNGEFATPQNYMFSRYDLRQEDFGNSILVRAAERFHPRKVVLRLLDLGGDKTLPYFPLPASRNPSLGQRGIRLLLRYPDILEQQLRAFLRVSGRHPVSILLPVVGGLGQRCGRSRSARWSAPRRDGAVALPSRRDRPHHPLSLIS